MSITYQFLSRASTLTRDIDIANLSVCPSVCLSVCPSVRNVPVSDENGLKGHSGAELHIYFLVHLESIYYEIFFYSKIVPNCAVAK